jgi:hypothetical protein
MKSAIPVRWVRFAKFSLSPRVPFSLSWELASFGNFRICVVLCHLWLLLIANRGLSKNFWSDLPGFGRIWSDLLWKVFWELRRERPVLLYILLSYHYGPAATVRRCDELIRQKPTRNARRHSRKKDSKNQNSCHGAWTFGLSDWIPSEYQTNTATRFHHSAQRWCSMLKAGTATLGLQHNNTHQR